MAFMFLITNITILFTEPFMQRALLAALFLGPLCGFLGVFVTARRMAFFSDTVAHGAMAGIACGFWFGLVEPTIPILVSSLLVAGGMLWLREHTELLSDTIMALLLAGSVAFGILVLSLLEGYRGEIHRYLFGDILAIGSREVWLTGGLFVVVGSWLFWQLSPLTLLTAQEEVAHVTGVPVRRLNLAFVFVLTVTVAVALRLLGIILVTSLLVVPAAAARNLSRNLRQQIASSLVIGVLGAVGGTVSAARWDVPVGPAIVLTCIALFVLTLAISHVPRCTRAD